MLARSKPDICAQAQRLCPALAAALGPDFTVSVVDCASQIGSGALPLEALPRAGLAARPVSGRKGVIPRLAAALRGLPTPVIGRIEDRALVLDLRCLDDEGAFTTNLAGLKGAADPLA